MTIIPVVIVIAIVVVIVVLVIMAAVGANIDNVLRCKDGDDYGRAI